MEARKTKKQVVQRVLQLLQSKPMTVNELSVAVKSNWDTVNNALELLVSINLIVLEEKEGKKIYRSKEENRLHLRKDTLFGIPITEEQENLCKLLFMKLKERWIVKKKITPNKTQVQKMAMEVANELDLKIPRGWYLFGDCSVLEYDMGKTYSYTPVSITGLDKKIDEIIEECSKFNNTTDLKKYHYQKSNNTLYLIKLKIQDMLTQFAFNKENLKVLSELVYGLIRNFPNNNDNTEIFDLLNTFLSTLNQLIYTKNENELSEKRSLLIDTFTALWELMATYHFFDDLAIHDYGYERDSLRVYFDERMKTLQRICRDYLSELDSLIIKQPIVDKNSPLLKYRGVIHNTKRLNAEDRKKLLEEFNKEGSNIFGEFNL